MAWDCVPRSGSFWTVVGVVIGFLLGEGSRIIRDKLRIRRLKRAIREELLSIHKQIDSKKDIIAQMIEAIRSKRILSGLSVAIIDTGYRRYAAELYPHQTLLERNCLHVIYERLRIADKTLNAFDTDFRAAHSEGVMKDPFTVFLGKLEDLRDSYDAVKKLIDLLLAGKAEDVFPQYRLTQ